MTAKELIKEGIFNQNNKKYPEAYQGYLKACSLGIEVLADEPSFQMIATCREALNRAEDILKVLAAVNNQQPTAKGQVVPSKTAKMVIPVSPLIKLLNTYSSNHRDADLKYQAELSKTPPDLKQMRETLQDVEVEKMRIEKVLGQIDTLNKVKLHDWEPTFFVKHVAYLSKSLYSQINVGSEVLIPSLDRISKPLMRFFAFQEYLHAILVECCSVKDHLSQTADFMVNSAYALVFYEHDIASASTFLEVLADLSFSKFVSMKAKPLLIKLIDLFGENTLDIHVEIAQDMVASHPVSSPMTCIVPNLEKLVKSAMDTYATTPIGDIEAKNIELLVTILDQTHFHGLLADIERDRVAQDSCLHWILSRTYLEKHNRKFWKDILESHLLEVDAEVLEPFVEEQSMDHDMEEKIVELVKEAEEELKKEETVEDPSDEMIRRLNALKDLGKRV